MASWSPLSVDEALRLLATCRPVHSLYAHDNGAWWVEPGCEPPQGDLPVFGRAPAPASPPARSVTTDSDSCDDSFDLCDVEDEGPSGERCIVQ